MISNFIKRLIAVYAILLFIYSCSFQKQSDISEEINELKNLIIYPKDSNPSSSIKFNREVIFGDKDELSNNWFDNIDGLGWFAGIEVDDQGRVFIGEYSVLTVYVFDSEGSYLTRIGQPGYGPGEYMGISGLRIIEDQLYIFDPLQFRLNIYSLDSLELIREADVYLNRVPLNLNEYEELTGWHVNRSFLIDENIFLVGYMEHPRDARIGSITYNLNKDRPVRYYFVNDKGKILSEKIFELKDDEHIVANVDGRHLFNLSSLPFLSKSLIVISNEKHLFTAWNENFLIKAYGPKGNYLRALYRPFKKKELIKDKIMKEYNFGEWNQRLLLHAELPKTWPSLSNLVIDDENRLWVSTIPDSKHFVREWWILKDTGEFIARFKWPDHRVIEKIKGDYLYVRETIESTGQQAIVKYRFEINQ